MTRKHASPTLRAIAEGLAKSDEFTQEQLQELFIHIHSNNTTEAARIIVELMTESRKRGSTNQYIASDDIQHAEE